MNAAGEPAAARELPGSDMRIAHGEWQDDSRRRGGGLSSILATGSPCTGSVIQYEPVALEIDMEQRFTRMKFVMSTALIAGGLGACASEDTSALGSAEDAVQRQQFAGHVYAMTNSPDGNAIIHYGRRGNGQLVQLSTTLTMGIGSGFLEVPDLTTLTADPLQSQQALRLTADHRFLMGVNTIDHTIAVFRVGRDGELELTDVQDSGGLFPNTIGEHDDLVYVGNIGNPPIGVAGNVTGFRLLPNGHLIPIPSSTRQLSNPAISLPAHALFSKDGDRLVVSDLFAEELDVFPVLPSGRLGSPTITHSAGPHPLGMIFGKHDDLLVSESGETEGSSVSSYQLRGTRLDVVSASVPNGQAGGCWLSITPDGRFAFSGNTFAPGNVSTYAVNGRGELTLAVAAGAERTPDPRVGSTAPLDSFVTADGRYFYQHFGGLGVVGAFTIGRDGVLTAIPDGDGLGLPFVGSQGLDGF
ncbi:MAG TPA: hypothetical protein VHW23_23245 [Kofleriaceae bacterium]|jgi:6-phosphogluconolactonase (cycloisomerase 2 family)|nr:hypothetical protein [Kofleriaceae bacterium]